MTKHIPTWNRRRREKGRRKEGVGKKPSSRRSGHLGARRPKREGPEKEENPIILSLGGRKKKGAELKKKGKKNLKEGLSLFKRS